jgi:hypothetical protein
MVFGCLVDEEKNKMEGFFIRGFLYEKGWSEKLF